MVPFTIYFTASLFWGVIFAIGIWPVRARVGIVCPGTWLWRLFCTLLHMAIWPLSVVQVAGHLWLNRHD